MFISNILLNGYLIYIWGSFWVEKRRQFLASVGMVLSIVCIGRILGLGRDLSSKGKVDFKLFTRYIHIKCILFGLCFYHVSATFLS